MRISRLFSADLTQRELYTYIEGAWSQTEFFRRVKKNELLPRFGHFERLVIDPVVVLFHSSRARVIAYLSTQSVSSVIFKPLIIDDAMHL